MNKLNAIFLPSIILLFGCSGSPSDGNIKEALQNSVSCELISFKDVKKIDTFEKIVDNNKYYVSEFSFEAVIKYNDEWQNEYKKYSKSVEDFSGIYEKYDKKFENLKENTVDKINYRLIDFKKQLNDFNENNNATSREEALLNDEKRKEIINMALQAIEEFKQNDVPKLQSLSDEYIKEAGGKSYIENLSLDYNNFDFRQTYYPFIKKNVIPSFSPAMPTNCISTRDSLTRKMIQSIYQSNEVLGLPKPSTLNEGISAKIKMTSFMRKTEKGWHIFE